MERGEWWPACPEYAILKPIENLEQRPAHRPLPVRRAVHRKGGTAMGYSLNHRETDALFDRLAAEYKIYAPKRFEKQGRYSDTDIIRYDVDTLGGGDRWDKKSDLLGQRGASARSPRPSSTLPRMSIGRAGWTRKRFSSSCGPATSTPLSTRTDLPGQRRLYDIFYKRMREKVKFVHDGVHRGMGHLFLCLDECQQDRGLQRRRPLRRGFLWSVKDRGAGPIWTAAKVGFGQVQFIEKNEIEVKIPEIPNKEMLGKLKKHDMWKEYNSRCISCGSCTVACSTCTCFTTIGQNLR